MSEENIRTTQDLHQKQALPLSLKVNLTKARIKEWIDAYGEGGVYVSFSGGKDSTVLLDLVRQDYPNVEAVFVDTGLEYPEIREFVKTFENVTWLKPKKNFRQVIADYGYPFISKEVSGCTGETQRWLETHEMAWDELLSGEKKTDNLGCCARVADLIGVNRRGGGENKKTLSGSKKGSYP